MWTSILIADLLILQITDAIHVGVGISDITGPAAGTPMVTFIELPNTYLLDVLLCQPIKLIQVVSTSEFHEYGWKDVYFNFFVPSI